MGFTRHKHTENYKTDGFEVQSSLYVVTAIILIPRCHILLTQLFTVALQLAMLDKSIRVLTSTRVHERIHTGKPLWTVLKTSRSI